MCNLMPQFLNFSELFTGTYKRNAKNQNWVNKNVGICHWEVKLGWLLGLAAWLMAAWLNYLHEFFNSLSHYSPHFLIILELSHCFITLPCRKAALYFPPTKTY